MRREKKAGRGAVFFALLLLVLAVMLLLRWQQSPAELLRVETPPPEARVTPRPITVETPPATPTPSLTLRPGSYTPRGYTAQTYQLVSDLVYTRRQQGSEGEETIQTLLAELEREDTPLAETWRGILDAWAYVNRDMPILRAQVPQNLPEDDSLCFVVLGFQLQYDGTMAPQMLGRCEAALACARRYPSCYLALTGGGTAAGDREKTEAGVMAEWFVSKGVGRERLIVEDASMTTDQNARNTCAILTQGYPQIRTLVIVTSDYHVPLGVLMFKEAALLRYYETLEQPFTVAGNVAFPTNATEADWTFWGEKNQGQYVWTLANPTIPS